MNGLKVILLEKEFLVAQGILHLIHNKYPETPIEVYTDPQKLPKQECQEPRIFILNTDLLVPPAQVILDKLYCRHIKCKFLALGRRTVPDNIMPYFSGIIDHHSGEKEIMEQLEKVFSSFENTGTNAAGADLISEREKEVLRGVALGLTNKEISEDLHISTHTVITHRKNISAKVGIKTIAGLAVYAVLNGIISPDELETE